MVSFDMVKIPLPPLDVIPAFLLLLITIPHVFMVETGKMVLLLIGATLMANGRLVSHASSSPVIFWLHFIMGTTSFFPCQPGSWS